MLKLRMFFGAACLLLLPFVSTAIADGTISFKGIKFGMKAPEIAKLGGGNLEYGCASAINDDDPSPWTYGGIDDWTASCVEGQYESSKVPGTSGMYKLHTLVSSHNNGLAKFVGDKTYSVDELVDIFAKVFGKFVIEKNIVENGLGQKFVKKIAIAKNKGALVKIYDNLTGENHEDYINIEITSIDWLNKKDEWEKKQNKSKLDQAKSDF